MKKWLILLVSLLVISPAWSNEFFNFGKNAYDMGQYGEAKEYLVIAVKNKPKNVTYRYYYAQSLLQLGMIDEAAEQYQIITLRSPNSQEGLASAKALVYINKYFENKVGEFKIPEAEDADYLPFVIMEDVKLKRWSKNQINVYVSQADSKDIVEKAFETWSSKSGKLLVFNFVPTKEAADITVEIVSKMPILRQESYVINGQAVLQSQEKEITHVDILVQESEAKTNEKFNPDMIYATALHEVGHALGLNGHSDSPKDIMYNELTAMNKTLSYRDVNTLKKLYKLNNENIDELSKNPLSYSVKLKQAQDYVQAYPNLYTAWSSLASAYVAVDDYENAIASIKKAIEIKGPDSVLYSQLANYYQKVGNNDMAIETFKMAYDLHPDNKVLLYNWAKACYKNKRAEEARQDVDKYLLGPGFLANDEISRSLRRMYKQDKEKEKEKLKSDREKREKKLQELEDQEIVE